MGGKKGRSVKMEGREPVERLPGERLMGSGEDAGVAGQRGPGARGARKAAMCWCGKMLPNVTSKLSRDIVILGLFGQCYHIFSLIFGQFHFFIFFIKVFILYSSRLFFWVKKPLIIGRS